MSNSVKNEFDSVQELSKTLGVSRQTLYNRAKKAGFDLNKLAFSDDEIAKLSSKASVKQVSNIDDLDSDKSVKIDSVKFLQSQIDTKDAQIEALNKQLETVSAQREAEATRTAKQIEALNKSLDQAQQLQLIAEQRLNEEHAQLIEYQETEATEKKRGFWAKLFG